MEIARPDMKVLQGQTLIDIAIQELGSAEGAFELAVLNGLSVTDELDPGRELQLPAVVNRSIAEYYANKGIKPATGLAVVLDWVFDDTFSYVFG